MVLGLEVGGDQRWDLTSDPCAERLGGFSFIVLDHLDLRGRGGRKYQTEAPKPPRRTSETEAHTTTVEASKGGRVRTHADTDHQYGKLIYDQNETMPPWTKWKKRSCRNACHLKNKTKRRGESNTGVKHAGHREESTRWPTGV